MPEEAQARLEAALADLERLALDPALPTCIACSTAG